MRYVKSTSGYMRSELEACTDSRQRWTVAKSYYILTINTQINLLQLMMLDFTNNFLNISCPKLNHCVTVLYVNYLALHRISLCLLTLFTLAHCLKPYHLSLLDRSQNFSHPYHQNLPSWTIYLHLSSKLVISYFPS